MLRQVALRTIKGREGKGHYETFIFDFTCRSIVFGCDSL